MTWFQTALQKRSSMISWYFRRINWWQHSMHKWASLSAYRLIIGQLVLFLSLPWESTKSWGPSSVTLQGLTLSPWGGGGAKGLLILVHDCISKRETESLMSLWGDMLTYVICDNKLDFLSYCTRWLRRRSLSLTLIILSIVWTTRHRVLWEVLACPWFNSPLQSSFGSLSNMLIQIARFQ